MDWSITHLWLIVALVLGLAELASGAFVLLALGVAAGLTAIVAALQVSFTGQLVAMGLFSAVLVPLALLYIRPRLSPRGVNYGTTGTGVEVGQRYRTEKRDFDGATGVKINGDFYRIRVARTGEQELPAGTTVIFERFDGTTAIVHRAPASKE
ncbi:NfeD family protein [Marinobacteraceae bacterium S3BR75-40.1]